MKKIILYIVSINMLNLFLNTAGPDHVAHVTSLSKEHDEILQYVITKMHKADVRVSDELVKKGCIAITRVSVITATPIELRKYLLTAQLRRKNSSPIKPITTPQYQATITWYDHDNCPQNYTISISDEKIKELLDIAQSDQDPNPIEKE